MIAAHPGLSARLDAVSSVVSALLSTGLALTDPDLPGELRELATDLTTSGLGSGAEATVDLAERLDAVSHADATVRRAAAREAYDALQRLSTWLRTWRAALALEIARERLGGAAPGPPPVSARPPVGARTVSVLGPEIFGSRVRLHAVDTADGSHVVLEEPRPPGLELGLDDPFPSRLLQADVPLRTLLDATIAIGGLPAAHRRGRLEVHPSFSRAAVLRKRRVKPELARGSGGRSPVRTTIQARSGPDGWTLETEDGVVLDLAIDEGLALDLVKRSADEPTPVLHAVLLRGGDTTLLLRIEEDGGPEWPWLDPTTHRWAASRLRGSEAMDDLLGARSGGLAPVVARWRSTLRADAPLVELAARAGSLPAEEGLTLLDAHLADLRGRIGKGDPVPSGLALWAAGHARAELRGEPSDTPVASLDLPLGRLRLAAAAPIARWLAGAGGLSEAVDGLLLAVASGIVDDLVAP